MIILHDWDGDIDDKDLCNGIFKLIKLYSKNKPSKKYPHQSFDQTLFQKQF